MKPKSQRRSTDYFAGTVMEPEVISTLKPSFSEYEAVGKELQDVNRRIEQVQEAMKLSRQNGAFQALQNQMKQVKELVKEKERLDAKMATMDLARKNDDDYRVLMRQETSYSERIDSVRDRINELEQMMLDFSEQGDSFDFARCQRADGSFYGTRGKCRKGSEAGQKEAKASGGSSAKARYKDLRSRARAFKSPELSSNKRAAAGAQRSLSDMEAKRGVKGGVKRVLSDDQVATLKKAARGKTKDEVKSMIKEAVTKSSGAASKPAPKARKTTSELNRQAEEASAKMKEANRARKQAEANFKKVEKETKGDNSPEARRRRIEAGREWNKASTAADRAEKQWMTLSDKASRSRSRDERKQMSPERRRQERELDKVIKERG